MKSPIQIMGHAEKKRGLLFVIYVRIKKDICNVAERTPGDQEVFRVSLCEVAPKASKNSHRLTYPMTGFLSQSQTKHQSRPMKLNNVNHKRQSTDSLINVSLSLS